jgi:hypothetical protein
MHNAKRWILAALVVAVLGGAATVMNLAPQQTAEAQPGVPPHDQWRFHDGHWGFWHAGDKRWYYTDGSHWYFHNGLAWVLYPFDHLFGRDFFHGEYKAPPPAAVVVPRHGVWR